MFLGGLCQIMFYEKKITYFQNIGGGGGGVESVYVLKSDPKKGACVNKSHTHQAE